VEGGMSCVRLTVHGQSFMLHHIRHMIGTAVSIFKGWTHLCLLMDVAGDGVETVKGLRFFSLTLFLRVMGQRR
jgi:hypothetical protein